MHVRLKTSDDKTVYDTSIPPFNTPPDILLWGARIFLKSRADELEEERLVYREARAFAIVASTSQMPATTPRDGT